MSKQTKILLEDYLKENFKNYNLILNQNLSSSDPEVEVYGKYKVIIFVKKIDEKTIEYKPILNK